MLTRFQIVLITLISLIAMMIAPVVGAALPLQDSDPETTDGIIIEGPVQAISVNIITIANIDITLQTTDPVLATIQVGDVVHVEGDVDETSGVLVVDANQVVVTGANIVTPLITITGPVQAVNVNIITVFNIDVQFNPDDLILAQLNVGDVISVGGNLTSSGGQILIIPVRVEIIVNVDAPDPEATPEVTPDPEATPEVTPDPEMTPEPPVTIVVEGPVEAINVNIITIFNIDIEVDPDDPILLEIEIGDHIRAEGSPEVEDGRIIIVAVHITIINVTIIQPGPDTAPAPRHSNRGNSGRSSRRSS